MDDDQDQAADAPQVNNCTGGWALASLGVLFGEDPDNG